MSLEETIQRLPHPFDCDTFTFLQRGTYDVPDTEVHINESGDFAFLYPLPQVDYVTYIPRVKALSLSTYKQTLSVVSRRFDKIEPWFTGIHRILEIGAGDARFLTHVKALFPNLTVASLEIDQNTKSDRDRFPALRQYGAFQEIRQARETFDRICMFHVLEHVIDPLQLLADCLAYLAPEGRLIIEVPSLDDPLLSLYHCQAYRKFYFQSQHPYIYSARSLSRLLEQATMQAEKVIPYQRYGLENHLNWLSVGKPGGDERLRQIFAASEDEYRKALERSGCSDTVIVVGQAVT